MAACLLALGLGACSSTQHSGDPAFLRSTGILDSQAEREARKAQATREATIARLKAGTPVDRVAAYGMEDGDSATKEMLANLVVADAKERSKRWLEAALTAYSKGQRALFNTLAVDALEMQVEPLAWSGGLEIEAGKRAMQWRVIPNFILYGNPDLDGELRDFPAATLGLDDQEAHKPWQGFASGFIRSQVELSKDGAIIDGPLGVLVVDYAENMRNLERILQRKASEMAHYEITTKFHSVTGDALGFRPDVAEKDRAYSIVSIEELDRVILASQGRRGGTGIIAAPRVTTLAGQLANVSIVNQFNYVKDAELRELPTKDKAKSRTIIIDPIIGTINDGLMVESRVAEIGGDEVYAQLHFAVANVQMPIPVFETELAEGVKYAIQVPTVFQDSTTQSQRIRLDQRYLSAPINIVERRSDGKSLAQHALYIEYSIKRVTP